MIHVIFPSVLNRELRSLRGSVEPMYCSRFVEVKMKALERAVNPHSHLQYTHQ